MGLENGPVVLAGVGAVLYNGAPTQPRPRIAISTRHTAMRAHDTLEALVIALLIETGPLAALR